MSYDGAGNLKLARRARGREMEKSMFCCKAMKSEIYYCRTERSQTVCDVQYQRWQIGLIYTRETTHRSLALCQWLVLQCFKRLSVVLAYFEKCFLPYFIAQHGSVWNVNTLRTGDEDLRF